MRRLVSVFAFTFLLSTVTACTDSGGGDGGGGDSGQFSGSCSLKVANGEQCSPAKGPVALLNLRIGPLPVGICTGAFLTPNTVVTAAHCFVDSRATGAEIIADTERTTSRKVTVHPQYSIGPSGGLLGTAAGAGAGAAIGASIPNGVVGASAIAGAAIGLPAGVLLGVGIAEFSRDSEMSAAREVVEDNEALIQERSEEIEALREELRAESSLEDTNQNNSTYRFHGASLGTR